MKKQDTLHWTVAALFLATLGCSPSSDMASNDASQTIHMDGLPPEMEVSDEHQHADHGPHGGEIVEMGGGELHAEWVIDENLVNVYLLGSDASEPADVAADEVVMNLVTGDGSKQFQFIAKDDNPSSAQSIRYFSLESPELANALFTTGARIAIRTFAQGVPYRGEIGGHEGHHH
jgi:hypothetical protein